MLLIVNYITLYYSVLKYIMFEKKNKNQLFLERRTEYAKRYSDGDEGDSEKKTEYRKRRTYTRFGYRKK